MPRRGNYTDERADAMLQEYVFPDEDIGLTFPTDLERRQASMFIRGTFGPGNSADPTARAMRVARFYALDDCAAQLERMITGNESSDDDLQKSCHLIVAICEFGTPNQQKAAVAEHQRLVDARVAEQDFETLVEAFYSLPSRTREDKLRDRLSKALAECERRGPAHKVGELMAYDIRLLPAVVAAKSRKDAIVRHADEAVRLERWAAVYLGLDSEAGSFPWDEHAGFGLMRDAWTAGDAPAVTALTAAMDRIDVKGYKELVQFQKTRGYRAREFFLEALTEEQRDDQDRFSRAQFDLIV